MAASPAALAAPAAATAQAPARPSQRVATIDWMRGLVMVLMAVAAVMLVLLYPACRWYRTFKKAHPDSFLKYL